MEGMPKTIKELWKMHGLRQFILRSILVLAVFLILPIVTYPFLEGSRYAKGTDPLLFILGDIYLVDIGASLIFMALSFVLIARNELINLKPHRHRPLMQVCFSGIGFMALGLYLYLRWFTAKNPLLIWSSSAMTASYSISILLALAALFLSVIAAVFPIDFLWDFLKRLKSKLGLSFLFFLAYIITTNLLKSLWYMLSTAVATCDYYLLGLLGDASLLIRPPSDPLLGLNEFVVRVGKDCSGIDSMTMFTGLFLLILAIEWHNISKKRMLAMFAVNVIRIALLMAMGIWISPDFAVGLFHSNAGWLLFVIYFVVFWWQLLPYVRERK
jgi:exosortase/archaeosortase family protein